MGFVAEERTYPLEDVSPITIMVNLQRSVDVCFAEEITFLITLV